MRYKAHFRHKQVCAGAHSKNRNRQRVAFRLSRPRYRWTLSVDFGDNKSMLTLSTHTLTPENEAHLYTLKCAQLECATRERVCRSINRITPRVRHTRTRHENSALRQHTCWPCANGSLRFLQSNSIVQFLRENKNLKINSTTNSAISFQLKPNCFR